MDRYPYFLYPAVCELKRNSDPVFAAGLKEFIAVNVGNREALLSLLGNPVADGESRPGGQPPVPDVSPAPEASPEVSLDPAPGEPALSESLDVIMERVKFLVKNRNYDEALQIMEAFYLNNPKKSVYFADQIRFLRKLKLNESKK